MQRLSRLLAAAAVTVGFGGCALFQPPPLAVGQSEARSPRCSAASPRVMPCPTPHQARVRARPVRRTTWMVDLGPDGRTRAWSQVLNEAHFAEFQQRAPGMSRDELLRTLGTPGERRHGGWAGGELWSWRYPTNDCLWFQCRSVPTSASPRARTESTRSATSKTAVDVITMSVILYGISNCDTVKRARAWLGEHGVAHAFHDFKKAGVPEAALDAWLAQAGWEKLLNRKGNAWRALDEATRLAVVDAATARQVMLQHASTIKRPVVDWVALVSRSGSTPRAGRCLRGLSRAAGPAAPSRRTATRESPQATAMIAQRPHRQRGG